MIVLLTGRAHRGSKPNKETASMQIRPRGHARKVRACDGNILYRQKIRKTDTVYARVLYSIVYTRHGRRLDGEPRIQSSIGVRGCAGFQSLQRLTISPHIQDKRKEAVRRVGRTRSLDGLQFTPHTYTYTRTRSSHTRAANKSVQS